MNLITSNEVIEITGFSYRFIQNLINDEVKTRGELPHYRVVGKRIFKDNVWLDLDDKFSKSKVVYEKEAVVEWFEKNYTNK